MKKAVGAPEGNRNRVEAAPMEQAALIEVDNQSAQIEHIEKSAERVAREHGVGQATVRRSADYSRAVNAIAEVAQA